MEPYSKEIRLLSESTPLVLTFEWIGEGCCGDYSPADPEDLPLMRFGLYFRTADGMEEVPHTSYCTNVNAALPKNKLLPLAHFILNQFEAAYDGSPFENYNPKRLAEKLSWTDAKMSLTPNSLS